MTRIQLGMTAILCMLSASFAWAIAPTADEMAESHRWAVARLVGDKDAKRPEASLRVLANHAPLQLNGRGGKPLRVGEQDYTRGLYCHAVSKVAVRLPSPGKTFSAIVGVDSNEQTSGGKGSVAFSVKVGDKAAFQSKILKEGEPGVAVQVELGGAKEFVLDVSDGGDGIGCDQADWADASVVLADGKTLWLGDLPLADGQTRPFGIEPCFSFSYGGKSSAEVLGACDAERASRKLDDQRTEHTVTYTDSATGLVLRCVGVEYNDFPAVEWTLYFKNTGEKDTPILENIQGIDVTLNRGDEGEFVLRGSQGDANMPDSYAPYEHVMVPNMRKKFAPDGGRPCDMAFPYFNLASPGGGTILAVGWPGQWSASFVRNAANGLRITAGQELTRFYLKPGEEVRSPLIAMLFWKGTDTVRSQNLWRRWMFAHTLPRQLGEKPLRPLLTYCTFGVLRWGNNTEAIEKQYIDELAKQETLPDYWWMDAGWFPGGQGQWMVARDRFPKGLKSLSDYVHARKMGLIVWFEPESAYPWSMTAKGNPKAMLQSVPPDPSGQFVLNLGDPTAVKWITDCVDRLIHEQGIDVYRQDFNMAPLGFWRNNDGPERLGITENLHVQGYLAFWDELLRRNPKLWIDSCAGGGRRNDLETLRRSVPLLRSDYQEFSGNPQWAAGNQGQTYGIASWIPYFGQNMLHNPEQFVYSARSYMCPAFGIQFDLRKKDFDWDLYRRVIGQWRQVADCYLGDYYPLTPYSLLSDAWIAWQFHRADQGDGMIQAFRHEKNGQESLRVKLCGLEAEAVYTLTNLDLPGKTEMSGRDLMEDGLSIAIKERPGAVILTYKKN